MFNIFHKNFVFSLIFIIFLSYLNFSGSFLYSNQQITLENDNTIIIITKNKKKSTYLGNMKEKTLEKEEDFNLDQDLLKNTKILEINNEGKKKPKDELIRVYPINNENEEKNK